MAGFSDIIGHRQIKEHLQKAISYGKVSHAYIFNGPEKSGKRMLAEAFAMALQCEKKGADACGLCHSCKQALSGNQPDILYLTHEKPATISVEDIRRQVNNDIGIKPYASPYRVYIIDEAEKMNQQAQNALLKTIEEPPPYAVLLLLTTNGDSFLPTILSRCITLNLKAVADEEIKHYLMASCQIPDYKADICTAFAQGNVGKALLLAGNEDFKELKDCALRLVKHIKDMELYEIMDAIKQLGGYKLAIADFLDLLMIWYRDVLYYKAAGDESRLIFKDALFDIKITAGKSSYSGIEAILKALEQTKLRLNANVNFDLAMELLLLTMKEN